MQLKPFLRVLLIVLSLTAAVLVVPALAQSPTTTTQDPGACATVSMSPSPTTAPTTPTTSTTPIIPPVTSSSTTTPPTTPTTSAPAVTDCPSPTTGATNNTTANFEGEGSPGLALPIVVAGILAAFVMMGRRDE